MVDGIRILNEQVLQRGRAFVVTDITLFPEVPVGSIYVDAVNNKVFIKKQGATDWSDLPSSAVAVGATPPLHPGEGDLWLDTSITAPQLPSDITISIDGGDL